MDLLSWALFALASGGALAIVLHLYRRREAPGRGRHWLAGLRWLTLTLLILLLFDPELPAPGLAAGGARTQVLLDASLSMNLPAAPGDTVSRWSGAVAQARRLADDGRVLLFGEGARLVDADSLDGITPAATASRLLPALRAASEAGARRVVVLTDGGLDDAADVQRLLPRLGVDVEIRPVAEGVAANRAIAEVEAPAWAEAGKPLRLRVGVAATGGGDSVGVRVLHDGKVVATARVPAPEPGRVAAATLEFTPDAPEGGGMVRYDVRLDGADAAPDDDARSVYVYVGDRPAGVALISLRPDWEPRFLQPVLEEALGLPVRGFLRLSSGRYLELGAGENAGRPRPEETVRRLAGEADLLVVHGLGSDAPAWVSEAVRRARRTLLFPAEDAGSEVLPLSLPQAVGGEWYLQAELPASPVAPMLTAIEPAALPPLTAVRPVQGARGAWSPLLASPGGRGASAPVVVAGEAGGRRWAVATAQGYWRWAFRGGEARQAYRRLWGALGGWLVQEEFAAGGAAIHPVRNVVARGEPIGWLAPGLAADSLALKITDESGAVVADTVVTRLVADSAFTAPLPPGNYRYEARAFAEGAEVGAAAGPFTVESYSDEYLRGEQAIAGFDAEDGGRAVHRAGMPGEPMHTLPWPYLAVVLLVCTEWVLRRRWGLR